LPSAAGSELSPLVVRRLKEVDMSTTYSDRRHPHLLGPQGEALLPPKIGHERRRRKVVEDLLQAMHERAQAGRALHSEEPLAISHLPFRRRFWIAIIAIAFLLAALLARQADHTTYHQNQIAGDGAAY
jgi:hypothetical protein